MLRLALLCALLGGYLVGQKDRAEEAFYTMLGCLLLVVAMAWKLVLKLLVARQVGLARSRALFLQQHYQHFGA